MEACARRGYELKPYTNVNGVHVLLDGKTHATEEQIMEREEKIDEYEWKENTAQHIILSTTSIRLGTKIKNLKSAKEMWEEVKRMLLPRAPCSSLTYKCAQVRKHKAAQDKKYASEEECKCSSL